MFRDRPVILHVLAVGVLLALVLPVVAQVSVIVRANANLNLRAAPRIDAAVLGRVPYDTQLTADALSPDRAWVAVVYAEQGGWMSLDYTSVVEGSLADLPLSDQAFTPGVAGGVEQVTSGVVVQPVVNVNYRANPTLTERPLGAIRFRTRLPALALSADGDFVLVDYQGEAVWVYRDYLREVSGALDDFAPGAPPVGEALPSPPAPVGDLEIGDVVYNRITDAAPTVDYRLYLNAGDTITLTLRRTRGNLDPLLRLYGPAGDEVAMHDDIDLFANDLTAEITDFVAPESGIYIVRATRFEGVLTTSWGSEVRDTTGRFRLAVTGEPAPIPLPPGAPRGVFLVHEGTSDPHAWQAGLPGDLAAASFDGAAVIGYVREALYTLETCTYRAADGGGGTLALDRVRVEIVVRLVNATTGAQVTERHFGTDPDLCPFEFPAGLTVIQPAPPSVEEALVWLGDWVDIVMNR